MKKLLITFFLIMFSCLVRAAITMHQETSKIQQNQSFRITLSVQGDEEMGLPDLVPLRKNFFILGTERRMNYVDINGQVQSTKQWIIVLRPKQIGTLIIPSIQFGNEKTPEGKIEVLEGKIDPTEAFQEEDGVKLIGTVDKTNPFINEQVIYTVKFYNNTPLMDVQYTPPNVANALIIPLGQAKKTQEFDKNNVPYVVEEMRFAIIPQKSGALVIEPPRLEAVALNSRYQRIAHTAKRIPLQVKPAAVNSVKNWLPAQQITLEETYQPSKNELNKGDTLTRVIKIKAQGVPGQLLPKLSFKSTEALGVYPEKPLEETGYQDTGLIGTSTIKVTYIINKKGEVVILKIALPWFNTVSNQQETAFLPKRVIKVNVGAGEEGSSGDSANENATEPVQQDEGQIQKHPPVSSTTNENKSWGWLAWSVAGFFALAWGITLFVLRVHKKGDRTKESIKNAWSGFQRACELNNPEKAKNALLVWGKLVWPSAKLLSIHDLMILLPEPDVKKEINVLSKTLYSAHKNTWQGAALFKAISAVKWEKNSKSGDNEPLPPMYPTC